MQSLYTKYRPKTLDEVLGQDHITKPLKQSIEQKDFSHSYIFYGTRGTGKTSIARIIANMLEVSQADLYEIDAASHTGVDTMRELLESVMTLPMSSEYKIYILDEVHMLSKSALMLSLRHSKSRQLMSSSFLPPLNLRKFQILLCRGLKYIVSESQQRRSFETM